MRTTLEIDDDLMAAAKELARRENLTAGQVVSRLLRQSLTAQQHAPARALSAGRRVAGGFRPFVCPGKVVTNDDVNALRDAEGV
jgi:predicted transcriptional regulator